MLGYRLSMGIDSTITPPIGALVGFVLGGTADNNFSVFRSSIDKLTYAGETVSTISTALSVAKSSMGTTQLSNLAYVAGGNNGTQYSTIEQMNTTTELISTISDSLSVVKHGLIGASSSTNGYTLGGYTTAYQKTIEKMLFSNETVTTIANELIEIRGNCAVTMKKTGATFSFIHGGWTTTYSSTNEKITFSTDTVTTVTDTLVTGKMNAVGLYDEINGFIGSGKNSVFFRSDVDSISFSTETITNETVTIDDARYGSAPLINGEIGYACGGADDFGHTRIDGLNMTTKTKETFTGALSETRHIAASASGV